MPPGFAVLLARDGGWPSVVAAAFAWLAVILLPLSIALLVGAVVIYRAGTDHGASAFAVGGVLASIVLFGFSAAVRALATTRWRAVRFIGAAFLVAAALLCAFYPLSWIRDPQSFPLVGAVVFAGLTILLLAGARSLVRGPS